MEKTNMDDAIDSKQLGTACEPPSDSEARLEADDEAHSDHRVEHARPGGEDEVHSDDSSILSTDDDAEGAQRGRRRRLRDNTHMEEDSDGDSYASANAVEDEDDDEVVSSTNAASSTALKDREGVTNMNKDAKAARDVSEEGERNPRMVSASNAEGRATDEAKDLDINKEAHLEHVQEVTKSEEIDQPQQEGEGAEVQREAFQDHEGQEHRDDSRAEQESQGAVETSGEDLKDVKDGNNDDSSSQNQLEVEASEDVREGDGQGHGVSDQNKDDNVAQEEAGSEESVQEEEIHEEEDRLNPQYTPRRGQFFEHDDRRSSSSDESEEKEKQQQQHQAQNKRVTKSEKVSKWGHDMFEELDQMPKSSEELVRAYGYDIRQEERAPRARRRRKYGRQQQQQQQVNNKHREVVDKSDHALERNAHIQSERDSKSFHSNRGSRGSYGARGFGQRGSHRGNTRRGASHAQDYSRSKAQMTSNVQRLPDVSKSSSSKEQTTGQVKSVMNSDDFPKLTAPPTVHSSEAGHSSKYSAAQDRGHPSKEPDAIEHHNKQKRFGQTKYETADQHPTRSSNEPRPFRPSSDKTRAVGQRSDEKKGRTYRQVSVPKDEQDLKEKAKGFGVKEKSVIKPFGNTSSARPVIQTDDVQALKTSRESKEMSPMTSSGDAAGDGLTHGQKQNQQQHQSKRYSSQRNKNTKQTTPTDNPNLPSTQSNQTTVGVAQSSVRSGNGAAPNDYGRPAPNNQLDLAGAPIYGQVQGMPAFNTPENFSPPLLNGSTNTAGAFMSTAPGPSAVHLHMPPFINQTGPPPINATAINYGAPPVPYAPVPIMEASAGPFSPSSTLMPEAQSSGGYAEVRGGVTYFNPSVQPIPGAGVSKRPKAAIPIIDPASASYEAGSTDWAAEGEEQEEHALRMTSSVCFGLHVGNTNACIAVHKDGRSEVVANPYGTRVSPCDVAFVNNSVLVGPAARQVKLQRDQEQAIVIANGNMSNLATKECNNDKDQEDKSSPKQVLSHILNYMSEIAKSHVSSSSSPKLNAVVTLPSKCDSKARNRIQSVFDQSPFHLLQVISEPAAALMAYDQLDYNGNGDFETSESDDFLMVRVGGTSTHLAALKLSKGFVRVLDSIESDRFGGQLVTNVVVDFLASEFKRKYKVDPLESKRARLKLCTQAEELKCVLSLRSTANCHIESLYDGIDFNLQVARARIENEINKVLPEFTSLVQQLTDRVQWNKHGTVRVLLCGGTTKLPRLQKVLLDLLPSQAVAMSSIPTDEVLALGAVKQAAIVAGLPKHIPDGRHQIKVLKGSIVAQKDASECLVLVPKGSVLPIRTSVPISSTMVTSCSFSLDIAFEQQTTSQPLGTIGLNDLTLEDGQPRLCLQVHVHRDGAAHLVLREKNSSKSDNLYINPPSLENDVNGSVNATEE